MVSVTCPCVECVHNGRRNKCTAKNISLTFRNMATVNEGRVDMWVCNKYEKSDFCKRFEEDLKNYERKQFEDKQKASGRV